MASAWASRAAFVVRSCSSRALAFSYRSTNPLYRAAYSSWFCAVCEFSAIRPGATITVLDVDTEKGCLLLKTKQGQTRSRPLSELQTIWNELNQKPAVHVEGVLHVSGTSRNQPETILANLPYIEWLKLNNKKHIAFVGKNTHPFETLKQMSPLDSVGISTLDSGLFNEYSQYSTITQWLTITNRTEPHNPRNTKPRRRMACSGVRLYAETAKSPISSGFRT